MPYGSPPASFQYEGQSVAYSSSTLAVMHQGPHQAGMGSHNPAEQPFLGLNENPLLVSQQANWYNATNSNGATALDTMPDVDAGNLYRWLLADAEAGVGNIPVWMQSHSGSYMNHLGGTTYGGGVVPPSAEDLDVSAFGQEMGDFVEEDYEVA